MDDGLTPAASAPPLWPRTGESPPPKGSERLRGHGLKHHKTPRALHTAGEDDLAKTAEGKAGW